MNNYRPYLSVDLETTGISDDCEVIQIAAVLDEPGVEIDKLKKYNQKIKYKSFHSEPIAMKINQKLINEMASREPEDQALFKHPWEAAGEFLQFLKTSSEIIKKWDDNNDCRMRGKIILAGKNVSGFDSPKLSRFFDKYTKKLEDFEKLISYKTLDPGSMYYPVFGYNASLSAINELTGRKEVSHDALDDALDVVYAVRHFGDKVVSNENL